MKNTLAFNGLSQLWWSLLRHLCSKNRSRENKAPWKRHPPPLYSNSLLSDLSVWCVCVASMAFWNRFRSPPPPSQNWEYLPAVPVRQQAGILAVPAQPAGGGWESSALLPDGRIQGRWTQKWPSKITCGLGNQRPNFLIAAWYEQKLEKIAQEQSLYTRQSILFILSRSIL